MMMIMVVVVVVVVVVAVVVVMMMMIPSSLTQFRSLIPHSIITKLHNLLSLSYSFLLVAD